MSGSLYTYNSLSLDAHAETLDHVDNEEQLLNSLEDANRLQQSIFLLGGGTNIVFPDKVLSRVIRLCSRGIYLLGSAGDEIHIRANAGENWHQFVVWTIQNKCYGLENLALIPGSVGAAPVQNIGAFGVELSSFISKVNCIRVASGESITLDAKDCRFGYRDSIFKRDDLDCLVIISVDFVLSRIADPVITYPLLIDWINKAESSKTPEDVFDAVVQLRRLRLPDPVDIPNVGSFFKNPIINQSQAADLKLKFLDLPHHPINENDVKLSAGWLIEHCGWKGYREESVAVFENHALVLINIGGATGKTILKLAEKIKCSVMDEFGIELEIEPCIVKN